MTAAYLGIDVGGTASRWVVIDAAGAEVGRGAAPGANAFIFNPADRQRLEDVLGQVAGTAPGPITAITAGLTGLGPPAAAEVAAMIGVAFGIDPAQVEAIDDLELAYRSVFAPGEGHLIVAGTGSIGLHIAVDGMATRVGGRGILVDDGGSGTWIALTAIDRLFRRLDETGVMGGPLATQLGSAVGGSEWDAMRTFVYGSDRGRIGTLARMVAEAATAGDPLATQVLADAVVELARLARALIGRCGALPVAVVGGIVDLHPSIRPGLAALLPDVTFPSVDAARHGAIMAKAKHPGVAAAGAGWSEGRSPPRAS